MEVLVKVLAKCDAIRAPQRDVRTPLWAGAYVAQRDLPTSGIPWGSSLADLPPGDPDVPRVLKKFCDDGLLIRVARGTVRTLGVLATPWGDAVGRAACGLPGRDDGLQWLKDLAAAENGPHVLLDPTGRKWVPEVVLAGATPAEWHTIGSAPLLVEEELFLAAAVSGWAESRADFDRHMFYSVAPAGRKAIATLGDVGRPTKVEEDPGHRDLYYRTFAAARNDLRHIDHGGEIGPCPLPVSHGNVETKQ